MEGNLIVIIIYVYLSFEPICDDLHFTTELHVTYVLVRNQVLPNPVNVMVNGVWENLVK